MQKEFKHVFVGEGLKKFNNTINMSDVDMFESQEKFAKKYKEDTEDSDIIPGTPINETKKKKKYRKKKTKVKDKGIIQQENNFKFQIQMTKTGNFKFNKPFVYHNIDEVLRYSLDCFPKNNNIHLIGVHIFSSRKGHYLEKQSDHEVLIPLDFTVASGIPNENETISVFGWLEFNNFTPVFVVKFFRNEVKIVSKKYIENLKEIRKYVPSDYLATVSINTIG